MKTVNLYIAQKTTALAQYANKGIKLRIQLANGMAWVKGWIGVSK